MVIATFGPSTGWAGKTIAYEEGTFALEGHGSITAADVLEYDREGHLSWSYAGLREWVGQVARGAVAPEPILATAPVVAPGPVVPVTRPAAVAGPVQGKRRFPVWAIVLIAVAVAAVFALVLLLAAALILPVHSETTSGSDSGSTSSMGTWIAQDSGTSADLGAVAFTDATHGWVVGKAGTILATTDGGATWSKQSSGSAAYLNEMAFTDATHDWVVGADGTILALAD
jgi:hypothetical protein